MNGLSIQESQHNGANGFGGGRSTYVPPHARSSGGSSRPPAMNGGGMDGSAWGPPP